MFIASVYRRIIMALLAFIVMGIGIGCILFDRGARRGRKA